MAILRILGGVLALLVVLLLIAGGFLYFTDLARFQPQLEKAVTEATGREFRIDGDFSVKLLPTPRLLVDGLSLANAPWGSEPQMATVGHFSAEIDPWSLLWWPVVIRDIQFADVRLLAESNAQGESNWDLLPPGDAEEEPESTPPTAPGDVSLPVMVQLAEFRNISLVLREPDSDEKLVRIDELIIEPNEADALGLAGSGEVLGHPLTLAGAIGPLAEVEALGAVEVDLNGTLGPLSITLDGQIDNLAELDGASLQALIQTEELQEVLKLAEVDLPLSGPGQVEATLTQLDDGAGLQLEAGFADVTADADARIGEDTIALDARVTTLDKLGKALGIAGLPTQELTLDGTLAFQRQGIELREFKASVGEAVAVLDGTLASGDEPSKFDLSAEGPRLSDLEAELPSIPFKLSASSVLGSGEIEVKNLDFRFGESDLTGSARVADLGKGKSVEAVLRSKLLDLTPFAKDEEPAAQTPPAQTAATPDDDGATDEGKSEFVFKDEPLPFAALKHNALDVDVMVSTYRSRDTELRNVKLVSTLQKQDLEALVSLSAPQGGSADAKFQLDTSGDDATLDLKVDARELEINIASGDDPQPGQIPEVGITMDIQSSGNTPRALAANADGRVLLTQGPGQVENAVLGRVSGDIPAQLFSALNPFAKEEKYSNWDCSIIGIDVVDGDADLTVFLLQGEKIMAVAGGGVDLNTEKLNIEFNTKPRKGVGISADMFVTPFISLRGTLASPRIGLNEKGAILTTGAAVATMGISLLVTGVVERATAEGDHCEKTLAEFGQHGEERKASEAGKD